jgi:hypothetical protein
VRECYVVVCYAMIYYIILYYTMLCYTMLCYTILCHAMPCNGTCPYAMIKPLYPLRKSSTISRHPVWYTSCCPAPGPSAWSRRNSRASKASRLRVTLCPSARTAAPTSGDMRSIFASSLSARTTGRSRTIARIRPLEVVTVTLLLVALVLSLLVSIVRL